MSTDNPFDFDLNADAYSELVTEASVDDRIGKQDFMVTEIKDGTWDEQYGGGPFRELKGVLTSANNAKVSLTISPPPPPEVVAAEKATWESKKKRAVAQTISIYRQLAEHYKTNIGKIQPGDKFRVEVIKTRRDASTGRGGFLRIAAFLAPVTSNGTAATSNSPF